MVNSTIFTNGSRHHCLITVYHLWAALEKSSWQTP